MSFIRAACSEHGIYKVCKEIQSYPICQDPPVMQKKGIINKNIQQVVVKVRTGQVSASAAGLVHTYGKAPSGRRAA